MYVDAFCKRIVDKPFLSGIIKVKLLTYVKNGGVIMPRRNGTGPNGYGPLTGRRMGLCARGLGYGQGYGRFADPLVHREEKSELLREKELLEQRLKDIDKQLNAQ